MNTILQCSICGSVETPLFSVRIDDSTDVACEGCCVTSAFRVIARPQPLAPELDRLWIIQYPDGDRALAHVGTNVRRVCLGFALFKGRSWADLADEGCRVVPYPEGVS